MYGTNLSTHFGKVFSIERTPEMSIVEAVRISMSIPLFFAVVRDERGDVFVDGGVLNNFPIKLFDRKKYISYENQARMAFKRPYYNEENKTFRKKHPDSSPYVYNKETLGFRLDTKQEIAVFRYGSEPRKERIGGIFSYIRALMTTILESQGNMHLHSDDWERTIYIDTKGVGTTDFHLSDATKDKLEKSGRDCAVDYFKWFDDLKKNMPYNHPDVGGKPKEKIFLTKDAG